MPALVLSHLTGTAIDLALYQSEKDAAETRYRLKVPDAHTLPDQPQMPPMPMGPGDF